MSDADDRFYIEFAKAMRILPAEVADVEVEYEAPDVIIYRYSWSNVFVEARVDLVPSRRVKPGANNGER